MPPILTARPFQAASRNTIAKWQMTSSSRLKASRRRSGFAQTTSLHGSVAIDIRRPYGFEQRRGLRPANIALLNLDMVNHHQTSTNTGFSTMCRTAMQPPCLLGVEAGNAQNKQMLSALPSLATGERTFRIGRFVPKGDIPVLGNPSASRRWRARRDSNRHRTNQLASTACAPSTRITPSASASPSVLSWM